MFIEDNNINNFNLDYLNDDYRITDLINIIKDNLKINNSTLQNELIKANIIAIQIGLNDYIYYSSLKKDDYINDLENDITTLFVLLRSITKEKIVMVGLYENNNYMYSKDLVILNEYIKNKVIDYDISYIDLLNIFNDDIFIYDSYKLTFEGNKYISKKIKKYI